MQRKIKLKLKLKKDDESRIKILNNERKILVRNTKLRNINIFSAFLDQDVFL